MLKTVLPFTANVMGKALVMPNLKQPILTVQDAKQYRDQVYGHLDANTKFLPLFTLYLTENTSEEDIREAAKSEFIRACKLYPAGATTNSSFGVRNFENLYPVLAAMEAYQLVLCIHGETTDPTTSVFEREIRFVQDVLPTLLDKFPRLKVVLEHISTKEAVDFVQSFPSSRLAATVTCHHLFTNVNALLGHGLNPHLYCFPILKSEKDRKYLIEAVVNDRQGKFFLGTDSAPHMKEKKECGCAAAGVFSAPVAMCCYTTIFEEYYALDQLEKFASENGSKFYDLPLNEDYIVLEKESFSVPSSIELTDGSSTIVPFCAGQLLSWKVQNIR
eukprot:jgi/Galph1/5472/GphlegSOOS_G4127.1